MGTTITVIDQTGTQRTYEADQLCKGEDGYLVVTKDGLTVALYSPGFIGAHKTAHLLAERAMDNMQHLTGRDGSVELPCP